MVTIHVPTTIKFWAKGEPQMLSLSSLGTTPHVLASRNVAVQAQAKIHCIQKLYSLSSFRYRSPRQCNHLCRPSKPGATKSWMCHMHIYASSDEDYRSSRNIAISLFRRYRNVIDRGGGDNLKEFIGAGVNAYALGCTDEGLKKELINIKDSDTEIERLQTYGGSPNVTFRIRSEEVQECILWLSIVFITILCTPQPTIVRWSSTPPVSTKTMLHWRGFCAVIANAYYVKGMAWVLGQREQFREIRARGRCRPHLAIKFGKYALTVVLAAAVVGASGVRSSTDKRLPVKTLQLEQMVVMGSAEEPSVVASRMHLAFSTLEVVSPQWPKV